MKIITVNHGNIFLLENFIASLGDAAHTFRYFTKRSITALNNHLITLLLLDDDGVAVGYGHLDQDADMIWVGIAVLPNYQGKGLGNLIMQELMDAADTKGINELLASVDLSNTVSSSLFKKHGFDQFRSENKISFYKRERSKIVYNTQQVK